MDNFFRRYQDHLVLLTIVIVTVAVFSGVTSHDFILYDDNVVVYENEHLKEGFSIKGITWALSSSYFGNWMPVTWLSHMLDHELFGLEPWGHHLHSLMLHILNSILLFLGLQAMTGARWRSSAVAFLFAVHPLHVEPVAWVAARRDLVSTLFWLLAVFAYHRYVKRRGWGRYLVVIVFFSLGLMAKAMVVTLPFALLLLDYWPLRRFSSLRPDGPPSQNSHGNEPPFMLVLEKVPLFLLSAGASVMAFLSQHQLGAVRSFTEFPIMVRIENALVAYGSYILQMLKPAGLAVLYPHPGAGISLSEVVLAFIFLFGLSIAVISAGKKYPYLPAGWFWYIGTMAPVIGLVQLGYFSMADRFTYVPLIGLFIILAWGAADIASRHRIPRSAVFIGGILILSMLIFISRTQAGYWRDSTTLFGHALDVTSDNYVIHNNMGAALHKRGDDDGAAIHYREALRINPDYAQVHYNLGDLLSRSGDADEAEIHFREALRIKGDFAAAHVNLGTLLARSKRSPEAVWHFRLALETEPRNAAAHYNLGIALLSLGVPDEADFHLRAAIEINPELAGAPYFLKREQGDAAPPDQFTD